jgi:hypothetical protein
MAKGWLDNFGKEDNYNDYNVSAPEGFQGDGYSNVGRNSSPAWGGQFQMGGYVYPVNYVPQAQTGGSFPGATGFSYARTGTTPSEGPYAKKTLPSAQVGIDIRKPGQSIKLSGMTNPGEVNYATYTPTLKGVSKAKTKLEKEATEEFTNWYSDPATKAKFQKNTGLNPERVQDLIGKALRTPMGEYNSTAEHDWPMAAGADAQFKSAWFSKKQGDPTAPETGYISYLPQLADIPELNVYRKPVKGTIGHELAHASGFDTTLAPALYRALGLKLPTKKEMPDLAYPSRYMQRPEEVYRESLKKRVKADKHNATNFWNYYSTDDKTGKESDKKIDKIVNAINTIAQVDTPQQDDITQTAQNGQEMKYYQEGLDWQPKTISKNGAWLDGHDVAQGGTNLPSVRDLWENAVQKNKAFGYYNNPRTVYGSMKSVAPYITTGALGTGAASQMEEESVPGMKQGGIIKDDRGQWDHPGEITEIGSNEITMEGVPYDVLGISDTGDTKLMKPGKKYKFKGKKVTEYPMAKNGVNQQDQKTLEHIDQLTNFTNYNTKQPGGWMDNLM